MTAHQPHDIAWFREMLRRSAEIEPRDPAPVLAWLEARRSEVGDRFVAGLIGLNDARGWARDSDTGNIRHDSGDFFGVAAVRVKTSLREVGDWDQPILTQRSGGVLAILCRRRGEIVELLLQAKAEPGNRAVLQLAPTLQSTHANLDRAHGGADPPLARFLLAGGARLVYRASHNEEGGRFWRKSNSNEMYVLDEETHLPDFDEQWFVWATMSQVKALALHDDVLSLYVKTIIAPF